MRHGADAAAAPPRRLRVGGDADRGSGDRAGDVRRVPVPRLDAVVVVPGGKVTMFFAALMFGEEGAEIMYPDPGFPIYRSAIEFSGATAVPIPLYEDRKSTRLNSSHMSESRMPSSA